MKRAMLALAAVFVATGVMAQSGYQIRPGDVLSVEVLQDPSLNREVLVLPDGTVSFPFAGNVQAAGTTTTQLQTSIAQGISGNFAVDPDVFVNVRETGVAVSTGGRRSIDVYFLGEFNATGLAELPRGTTLLQALAMGGGFTNFAAQSRVQLRRVNAHTGETSVVEIDYRAIADGGILNSDPVLADGDVILAPERRLFE